MSSALLVANARLRAEAKFAEQVLRARRDPAAFIEFAIRDEGSGRVLRNADFHREWQELLTQHANVVLIAPVEHGKTQQVVGRLIWELGRNPNLRMCVLSNTAEMAEKVLKQVRTQIEENPRIRQVFPGLVQSDRHGDPWTQSEITVKRSTIAKDPSLQAHGVYGPIVGSRLDLILLDDVLDFDNARTDEQRKKLIDWFDTTVLTRATAAARIWAIGTPWDNEDLLAKLAERPGFTSRRYSAVANDTDEPSQWRTLWPAQWPASRLLHRRQNMLELAFARKYLCKVRADATARFKDEWLAWMSLKGKDMAFHAEAPRAPNGVDLLPCFTGVDLGVGEKATDGLTCIFTIAVDPRSRRIVCEIQSGHWRAPEILDRLASVHRRFDSHIAVESNAAQMFIVQIANGRFPVKAANTGKNKWDPELGVESLAVEMRNGLWVLPSGSSSENIHPEGKAWIREMRYFDPGEHTGDRLMASWIALTCARQYLAPRSGNLDTMSR